MIFLRMLGVAVLIAPSMALAAARTFRELALQVATIIDTATFVLIMFGLAMYFWGMLRSIPHFGDEKGAERRKSFFWWGIIVLFVMVSIWGIIQILQNSLLSGETVNPATGAIRGPCSQGICPEGLF